MFVKHVDPESVDELWQVLMTAASQEAFFCSQQAGDAPAVSHVAVAVTLDSVSYLARPAEHGLNRVRCSKEAFSVTFPTKRCDRQGFFKAFQKTVRGIGIDRSQQRYRVQQKPFAIVVVQLSIRFVKPATNFRRVLLRDVSFNIASLVFLAALDHRVLSENSFHASRQSLGAIETEQRWHSCIQTPVTQVRQQRSDNFGVLRFTILQPDVWLRFFSPLYSKALRKDHRPPWFTECSLIKAGSKGIHDYVVSKQKAEAKLLQGARSRWVRL